MRKLKIITSLVLSLISINSFSQQFARDRGLITMIYDGKVDTIGRISKVSCENCYKEEALGFKVPVDINLVMYKKIPYYDVLKMESAIFNSNCNINYIDSFVVSIEKKYKTDIYKSRDISEYDMKLRLREIDVQNRILTESISESSNFLIISANQRNQSIIVGIVGSVISTLIITSNIRNGNSPTFGYIIGIGTSVSFLTLQISSNNNLKKAGLALKL